MDFEIQLPEEITNLMNGGGLPSPEMMNFYVDEKDRIFFIDFEIDQSLIEIERKILQYNRIDKDIMDPHYFDLEPYPGYYDDHETNSSFIVPGIPGVPVFPFVPVFP